MQAQATGRFALASRREILKLAVRDQSAYLDHCSVPGVKPACFLASSAPSSEPIAGP